MRYTFLFVMLSVTTYVSQVLCAAVTLFVVSPTSTPGPSPVDTLPPDISIITPSIQEKFTDIVSAVRTSTDSDGPFTEYEWKEVVSELNLVFPSTTLLFLTNGPATLTYTLQQASTSYNVHIGNNAIQTDVPPVSASDECTFDVEKGTGECVRENVVNPVVPVPHTTDGPQFFTTATKPTTLRTTFTGTLLPIATLQVGQENSGVSSVGVAPSRLGGIASIGIAWLLPMFFVFL